MEYPVRPEDVKVVQGASGKGLQVTCACGCVNWNHVEVSAALWVCRNCGQVLSNYFPGLVRKVLSLPKPEAEPQASPAAT
jgi:hypothetical protein